MQLYKHNTSRDGTHKQAGGRSVDATLFAKELSEKLHTPTHKGWREAKKVKTDFDWCVDVLFTIAGVYIYTLRPKTILVGHVLI